MTWGESPPHVLTHVAPGCRNVTTLYFCKLPCVFCLEIKSHLNAGCHTSQIWLLNCDLQNEWDRFSMLQEELKVRCSVSVNRSMLANVSLKATTTISVVRQQRWLLWDDLLHCDLIARCGWILHSGPLIVWIRPILDPNFTHEGSIGPTQSHECLQVSSCMEAH